MRQGFRTDKNDLELKEVEKERAEELKKSRKAAKFAARYQ